MRTKETINQRTNVANNDTLDIDKHGRWYYN